MKYCKPVNYDTDELIFIERVEVCAIKDPMPSDGPVCLLVKEPSTMKWKNYLMI